MLLDLSERNSMTSMFVSMLSHQAEMENEVKSAAVRAGMEESARAGNWQGGPVPFGLHVVDGSLEIDPLSAEGLRIATEMILAGHSTTEAAERLNAMGLKPPRSPAWRSQELRRHLRRETLSGVHRWGDVIREVPQVIDPPTWRRLQQVPRSDLSGTGPQGHLDAVTEAPVHLRRHICGSWAQTPRLKNQSHEVLQVLKTQRRSEGPV